MVGNDIVDLARAQQESNWQRRGFLQKIFTADEQRLIRSASHPEQMVWTLWSMKESAYKLIVRQTGQPFFAPQKLACHSITVSDETIEGCVFYQNEYLTWSRRTPHYIASVALPADYPSAFSHQIIPFNCASYSHQHEHLRQAVKQFCTSHFALNHSAFQLLKDEIGVPSVQLCSSTGRTTTFPISLSHHGYFGSFAIVTDSVRYVLDHGHRPIAEPIKLVADSFEASLPTDKFELDRLIRYEKSKLSKYRSGLERASTEAKKQHYRTQVAKAELKLERMIALFKAL